MKSFNVIYKFSLRLGLIAIIIIASNYGVVNPTFSQSLHITPLGTIPPEIAPDPSPATIPPDDIVLEMLGQVNISRALVDLKQLTGEVPICIGTGCYTITNRLTGSEGLSWAKEYVYTELARLGYSVEIRDWSRAGYADQNIIARKPGVLHPEEEIYFVAHLDGVKPGLDGQFPAADDNGSGVVDILELARVLNTYSFSRTVILLVSTGEEQGTLGVQSYLSQLSPIELNSIKYVVNIDMVGYDANHDRVMELWYGDHSPSFDLVNLMKEIIQTYQLELVPGFVVGCGWGDEVPFREKGIPTGLQIENYEDERNPYYHSHEDRIAYINLDYFLEQMKATTAIAAHLAIPLGFNYKVFLPVIGKP
jgi:hypothetical protein